MHWRHLRNSLERSDLRRIIICVRTLQERGSTSCWPRDPAWRLGVVNGVERQELFTILSGLRRANVGSRRAPHKPLLLLWLFARLQTTGSTAVSYAEAEQPVSALINEYGPSVRSPSAAVQRAAMPFVHLERTIWSLCGADGTSLPSTTAERRQVLLQAGARGRLRPEVEALLAQPGNIAAASQLLLEQHFTPMLAWLITDSLGLIVEQAVETQILVKRRRSPGFAEDVKRAYAYQCAMCGFDGALGRVSVGLEAAHVRWHSQDGPDQVSNGLCLCELHHALFDLGVLGLTEDHHITVSPLYVARTPSGRMVDALAGVRLANPRPGNPAVQGRHVHWHATQVFKNGATAA